MDPRHFDVDQLGADGAELARYRISAGERVMIGWRRPGGLEVVDRAVDGRAHGYVVDRGFCCLEQLAAFVGEYVQHALRLDACPMSAEGIAATLGGTDDEMLAPLLGFSGSTG